MAAPVAKNEKYSYPSLYGSHISMKIADREDGTVICRDEFGEYWTYKDRLDNHLADPCRYSASHRLVKTKEEAHAVTDRWGPGVVYSLPPVI